MEGARKGDGAAGPFLWNSGRPAVFRLSAVFRQVLRGFPSGRPLRERAKQKPRRLREESTGVKGPVMAYSRPAANYSR